MSTCADTSNTTDTNSVEIALAVVIPLLMVAVVDTLIVICIIACHKSPKLNNRIKIMCGKVIRYRKPRPHSLSHARSDIHSATELTLTMESQINDGEMNQNGNHGESEQSVAGGIKRSTISQQNQAYGIHGGVKRSTVTQQNEAYGLTKTGTPALAFSTKQPDTGQESDEYSYVRFQRK